jgi:hypothetical protein
VVLAGVVILGGKVVFSTSEIVFTFLAGNVVALSISVVVSGSTTLEVTTFGGTVEKTTFGGSDLVVDFAGRVVVIFDGRVVYSGSSSV